MRKKISAAVLAVMMSIGLMFSLAACGKSESAAPADTAAESSAAGSGREVAAAPAESTEEESVIEETAENAADGEAAEAAGDASGPVKSLPLDAEAIAAAEGIAFGENTEIVIFNHRIETESIVSREDYGEFPFAYVTYPEIYLTGTYQKEHPALAQRIAEDNALIEEKAIETLASISDEDFDDGDYSWLFHSNYQDQYVEISRADDAVFSYVVYVDNDMNGVHPVLNYRSVTYDAETGEQIPVEDVVTDVRMLEEEILPHLYGVIDDYTFTDEDYADMEPKVNEYVSEGYLIWTMEADGLKAWFGPYALQYYAFGPIFADLPYKELPKLFEKKYLPSGRDMAKLSDSIERMDSEVESYSRETLAPIAAEYWAAQEALMSEAYDDTTGGYYGPARGELCYAIEGSYYSGRAVIFQDVSYFAQPEGIYRLKKGDKRPELYIDVHLPEEAQICTDGVNLYYADADGAISVVLIEEEPVPMIVVEEGVIPAGSSFIGFGRDHFYVQTPFSYEDDLDEEGIEKTALLIGDQQSGKIIEELPNFYGGSVAGYVYAMEYFSDISPSALKVYNYAGELVVDEELCYGMTRSELPGGLDTVYYVVPRENDPQHHTVDLYKMDVNEPVRILERDVNENMMVGAAVGGFLSVLQSFDDNFDYSPEYIDLRTGETIPRKVLELEKGEEGYWTQGITVDGKDYYISARQVAVMTDAGLREVFTLPEETDGDIYVTDGNVVVDEWGGKLRVYPLD